MGTQSPTWATVLVHENRQLICTPANCQVPIFRLGVQVPSGEIISPLSCECPSHTHTHTHTLELEKGATPKGDAQGRPNKTALTWCCLVAYDLRASGDTSMPGNAPEGTLASATLERQGSGFAILISQLSSLSSPSQLILFQLLLCGIT